MPTYEFSCPEGHDFEKFYRSMAGAPTEVACPVCGRPATRRVSGGAGLLFKGSGFYITDYGKDGKKDLKNSASKPDAGKSDASAKSDASVTSGSSAPAASTPPAKGGE
jgi:putative FmdB family regulatory protein